jgi:prepilin-type N-terminal cleavage/methylation domain-containing protein
VKRPGFSLFELMVVMAIVMIMAGASVAYVGTYMPRRQVEGAAFQLVQDLRDVQSQAVFKRHVMEVRFRADATHNEYEFETKPDGFALGSTMSRTLTKAVGFPAYVNELTALGSSVYLSDAHQIPDATTVSLFFDAWGKPAVDAAGTDISLLGGAVISIVAPSGAEIHVKVSPIIGQASISWQ